LQKKYFQIFLLFAIEMAVLSGLGINEKDQMIGVSVQGFSSLHPAVVTVTRE